MDNELLMGIGLTPTQAKAYAFLIAKGPHSPPDIARELKESRTNTYNVLEKLLEIGLVKKFDQYKKYIFQAEPPTALERLVQEKRDTILQQERQLHAQMPALLSKYFSGNEKPGVRFFQGEAEVKQAYFEQTAEGQPVYMIRPLIEKDLLDFDFLSELRHGQRRAAVWRHVICPDQKIAPKNYRESDPFMLVDRTWMNQVEYTEPVEWAAYGDKLTIYSFGEEAMAMTIDSPQVAESFRQIHAMLSKRIKCDAGYENLPKLAQYSASTKEKPSPRKRM